MLHIMERCIRLNGTGGDIGYGLAQIFSMGTFAPAMKAWCKAAAASNYAMVAEFGADIGAATGFQASKSPEHESSGR